MAKDDRKQSKVEQRATAEADAACRDHGGAIRRGPDVVSTLYICAAGGAQPIVGIAEKQPRDVSCPKCGSKR